MGEVRIEVPDADEIAEAVSEDIDSIRDQQIEMRAAIAEVCGKLDAVAAASLATSEAPEVDLSPVLSSIQTLERRYDTLAARIEEVATEKEAALPEEVPPPTPEMEMPPPVEQHDDAPTYKSPFAVFWEWLAE